MAPYVDTARAEDTASRTTACTSCPHRSECFGRIYCSRKQASTDH